MIWDCKKRRQDKIERYNRKMMETKKVFSLVPVELSNGKCIWLDWYYMVCREDFSWHPISYFKNRSDLLRLSKRTWYYDRLTTAEYNETA